MVHRKINHQIIASIAIIFLLVACKKRDAKWPVYVTVSAKMAHNNTPLAGVQWKIIESSSQGSSGILSTKNATGWEQEGVTNSAGLAIANFYPKKDLDYHYEIVFDYSSMDVPVGNYEIVNGPSTFAIILRENENIYDIRVLPYMDINLHYKNINCFDGTDIFKFKNYNASEKPNYTQGQINNIAWVNSSSNQGCVDRYSSGSSLAGQYIYIYIYMGSNSQQYNHNRC